MNKEQATSFFSELYGGDHKLPGEVSSCGIGWKIKDFRSSFSTFDGNTLTKLVLMAHDKCVRVDIQPLNENTVELCIWQRQREGSVDQRHPTIEQAVSSFRGEKHCDDSEILKNILEGLASLNQSVKDTRAVQKLYFRTRTPEALKASKECEKVLDLLTYATDSMLMAMEFKPADSGSEHN